MMLKMLKLSKESDVLNHPSTSIEIMLKMLGIYLTEAEINNLLEPEALTDFQDKETLIPPQKKKKLKDIAASQSTQTTYNSHPNQKASSTPKPNIKNSNSNQLKKNKRKWN